MEFCPMCKRLLVMKEEKGRNIGFCLCGFKRTTGISIIGEQINLQNLNQIGGGIVDFKNKDSGFFKICNKCGFDKCEISQMTSNESEISLFKCLNCGFVERQSQGVSKA